MFDEKIRKLSQWSKGNKIAPLLLDINPTDKCNLKCLSCWQRLEKFKKIDSSHEVIENKLISVVKEALDFDVNEFEITGGGEPMMRKDVTLKIMKLIKECEKIGNITTNGTLFDEETIRFLVRMEWDRITLSLDGANSGINDYLRGSGSYEKIIHNIKLLNKLKKSFKTKKPTLKFNVVVNRKNYDKLDEIVKLGQLLNCKIINFEPLTVHSSIGKKLSLRKKEMKQLKNSVSNIVRLAHNLEIVTNI
jgi:MoaA/NifB/PqqE/SkfB family radical SAM enzyme